jgi:hypothetical protein
VSAVAAAIGIDDAASAMRSDSIDYARYPNVGKEHIGALPGLGPTRCSGALNH